MTFPISVYLDSNVWNFLFERKLDLAKELPRPNFCLCLTREAELEIPPIPNDKSDLKAFIKKTIKDSAIDTRPYFGFYDETLPPDQQRVGGFDQGYWISQEEADFIDQQRTKIGALKKSGLYKNEADLASAARSLHSVVLSLDDKAGPLNTAYQQGGKIVFLTDFDGSGLSLSDFIEQKLHLKSAHVNLRIREQF